MYRTNTEYEEELSTKLFVILSLNYYFHAFYIAFIKGRYLILRDIIKLTESLLILFFQRIKISYNGQVYSETVRKFRIIKENKYFFFKSIYI